MNVSSFGQRSSMSSSSLPMSALLLEIFRYTSALGEGRTTERSTLTVDNDLKEGMSPAKRGRSTSVKRRASRANFSTTSSSSLGAGDWRRASRRRRLRSSPAVRLRERRRCTWGTMKSTAVCLEPALLRLIARGRRRERCRNSRARAGLLSENVVQSFAAPSATSRHRAQT